MFDYLFMMIV